MNSEPDFFTDLDALSREHTERIVSDDIRARMEADIWREREVRAAGQSIRTYAERYYMNAPVERTPPPMDARPGYRLTERDVWRMLTQAHLDWSRGVNRETEQAVIRALAQIFTRLGMGDQRIGDTGLDEALQQVDRRIEDLKRHAAELREFPQRHVAPPAQRPEYREVIVDSNPDAHNHHVQFKILNIDDEVVDASEWVLERQAGGTEQAFQHRVLERQTKGEDVFLRRYNRCAHVNLTVQVDREDDI